MPKIIENLEARILEEAGRQLEQTGYGSMTIRSIAKGCNVGIGTVYNYFPSKDALVATYMLQDWKVCMAEIERVGRVSASPEPVVRAIYDQLLQYVARHQNVFRDASAAAGFAESDGRYHEMLRTQLAQPLVPFCREDPFMAEFLAESLLTWTLAETDFEDLYRIISKLF